MILNSFAAWCVAISLAFCLDRFEFPRDLCVAQNEWEVVCEEVCDLFHVEPDLKLINMHLEGVTC